MSPSKKANNKKSDGEPKIARKAATSVQSSNAPDDKHRREILSAADQLPALAPSSSHKTSGKSGTQTTLLRILALVLVVGITYYIYSIRDRVEEFAVFGYPGIFLIALLANATILLPAPGVAVIYAMGAVFNPIGVGLAAGTGGAIGELSGFLAGFSGQAVIERTEIYDRTKPWIDKYGGWAILVLAAIPNPFFDIAGIAAGIAKMRLRTFLFFVWIGQLIKMTFFAYAGRLSLDWLAKFLN